MSSPVKNLHVILKVIERCNLACSYCYFFFGGDDSYKNHPPVMRHNTISDIADFLAQGIQDLGIETLNLYFHGGEPLLQRKIDFDAMCNTFSERLSFTNLLLGLQTNATLIDEEWIDLFKKHKVSVGVSVDGDKETHDQYRIDKKGKGSYERTKKGIFLLRNKLEETVGGLCVVNPHSSGKKSYEHLVHDLGFTHLDFLFPDNHYDNSATEINLAVGNYLCEAFDAWIADDNPNIHIRFFSSLLSRLLGKDSHYINFGPLQDGVAAISVSSNGELSPDDTLKPTSPHITQTGKTIYNASLKDFLREPVFGMLHDAKTILPSLCQECVWQKICAGGEPINRYRKENNFDNPSVYCTSLKRIYEKVTTHLLRNGYEASKLAAVLSY